MSEQEWLAAKDPTPMLESLLGTGRVSERKLRLFAAAARDRLYSTPLYRDLVVSAEQRADGLMSARQIGDTRMELEALALSYADPSGWSIWSHECLALADLFGESPADELARGACSATTGQPDDGVPLGVAAHLRDVFGNPFCPVAFFPEWRTGTAVTLARQMYESRDFGTMPILADAIQDAGCDNNDILDHCRDRGSHVRGCWVVDMILGKE